MKPTDEQLAIIDAARSTSDNLLVSALAGAAKTSTLVMVAEALKTVPMLCLAFNKRIAVEMQERLPGNCEAMTLNSLGHRVWSSAVGKGLRVDTGKTYKILKSLVEELSSKDRKEAYEDFSETMKAVAQGKAHGYVPDGHYPQAKRLHGDDDFFASLEDEPTPLQEQLIREATLLSMKRAFQGEIDFDDQILMPTIFPCSFPQYPCVLIDEAQDLSELNHATLRKMAKKRLIAVGDECQSIYGFRGAHEESMAVLQQSFDMRKLILSISFRCPTSIVEAARWRAPHMRWPEWARPGRVETRDEWSIEDLPNTATILCRNNAPIFYMAIQLLKNGRYPEIVGNDIGKNLLKVMKKLGDSSMPRAEVEKAIDAWLKVKLAKTRAVRSAEDQADCLRVFAAQGRNLGDAVAYAEHLFNARGPITMMTGHKAKGLEFDTVFILDRHLVRTETGQQEANLLYVMQTRSKDTLTYITTEGFHANATGETDHERRVVA